MLAVGLIFIPGCTKPKPSQNQNVHAVEAMEIQKSNALPTVSSTDSEEPVGSLSNSNELGVEDQVEPDKAYAEAVEISADGFPTGSTSPEGIACDLTRAFMTADDQLWKSVCFGQVGESSNDEYAKFIDEMSGKMDAMKEKAPSQRGGPKEIMTVYKARDFSLSGPASYGYAAMNLNDVKFVDVAVTMWDDSTYINRTLVLQTSDNRWYAMPRPDLFRLLSMGLNTETDSVILWDD